MAVNPQFGIVQNHFINAAIAQLRKQLGIDRKLLRQKMRILDDSHQFVFFIFDELFVRHRQNRSRNNLRPAPFVADFKHRVVAALFTFADQALNQRGGNEQHETQCANDDQAQSDGVF